MDQQQIRFKTLNNQTFDIQISPAFTVLDLKALVKGVRNIEPDCQQLFYMGKKLQDSQIISEVNFSKDTFVLISQLKKFPNKQQEQSQQQQEQQQPDKKIQEQEEEEKKNQQKIQQEQKIEQKPQQLPQMDQQTLFFMQQGYTIEQINQALEMSGNDPNNAYEILLAYFVQPSVQENKPIVQNNQQTQIMNNSNNFNQNKNSDNEDFEVNQTFKELMKDPLFVDMVNIVKQNPSLLGPVMEQTRVNNPAIFKVLSDNLEGFKKLLFSKKPIDLSKLNLQGVQQIDNQVIIDIDYRENKKLNNLSKTLHIKKEKVIEGYLLCERDIEKTWNFFLDPNNKDILSDAFGNGHVEVEEQWQKAEEEEEEEKKQVNDDNIKNNLQSAQAENLGGDQQMIQNQNNQQENQEQYINQNLMQNEGQVLTDSQNKEETQQQNMESEQSCNQLQLENQKINQEHQNIDVEEINKENIQLQQNIGQQQQNNQEANFVVKKKKNSEEQQNNQEDDQIMQDENHNNKNSQQ